MSAGKGQFVDHGRSPVAKVGGSKEKDRRKGCQLNCVPFPVGSVSAQQVVISFSLFSPLGNWK